MAGYGLSDSSMETGEELPPNEIGEIAVKGPQVMKGYWNRPEETENNLKMAGCLQATLVIWMSKVSFM